VSPDGETVAFISSNELTGQDSTDANSGEDHSQVYLWDAGDEQLRCVSCNRTGARPIGGTARSSQVPVGPRVMKVVLCCTPSVVMPMV